MAEMLTDILSERQRKLFDAGKDADFVFLDENLELLKVILKGKEVPYD